MLRAQNNVVAVPWKLVVKSLVRRHEVPLYVIFLINGAYIEAKKHKCSPWAFAWLFICPFVVKFSIFCIHLTSLRKCHLDLNDHAWPKSGVLTKRNAKCRKWPKILLSFIFCRCAAGVLNSLKGWYWPAGRKLYSPGRNHYCLEQSPPLDFGEGFRLNDDNIVGSEVTLK